MSEDQVNPLEGMSMKEAAHEAGVHECTIRRWIEEGHLPAFRIAGSVRIRKADLYNMAEPVEICEAS